MKLSEKYIAGFMDADGSFGVKFNKTASGYKPAIWLKFSQETAKDKVLEYIQQSIGGSLFPCKNQTVLEVPQKQARKLLSRIRKHLVIKRHFAEVCLQTVYEHRGVHISLDEVHVIKAHLKHQRKHVPSPMPNFPSRKWVAGYFDGDGCLAVSYRKHTGCCYISARVTAEMHYRVGVDLLLRAFGGKIYDVKKTEGVYPMWVLSLTPSKAKKFITYFAKHSVVKRDQLYFVLRCAEGGNFRDGKAIQTTMKHLKAQEQRLSDPSADIRALVENVDFNVKSPRFRNRPTEYRVSDSPAQM